jgi:HD-GYP domain-containing protein (c-di-GMP phosphodiesterase class II)
MRRRAITALRRLLVPMAAVLFGVLVAIGVSSSGILDRVESDSIDARFSLRSVDPPDNIVVVQIGDEDIDTIGRWPFRRTKHAIAVDRLRKAGARLIVYDVQFTEESENPDDDWALYDALGRAGGAVLATTEVDGHGHTNVLGGDDNLAAIDARAAATNLNNRADGAIDKFPRSVAGVPSFPVAVARRAQGHAPTADAFDHGEAWIDYRGARGTFPMLSFSSVVRGKFDPRAVRGKVVVVGAVAPALQDNHATPIGGGDLMSGPEVEANAIWTALHRMPLRNAPFRLDLIALLLLAFTPLLLRVRLPVLASIAGALVAGGGFLVVAQLVFDSGVVLAVVAPLVSLAVATVGVVLASYRAENRERRRVAEANTVLARDVQLRTEELEDTQLDVVRRLAAAVESRDAETGSHVDRISKMCERLALAVGVSPADAEMIRHASALHDMGKIAIPDAVLLKPGKLDGDEWQLMKTHTDAGAELLAGSRSPLLQLGEVIARTHHERWDGSGYPAGLAGEEIPLSGRICSICDTYDALVSKRPYKDPVSKREALAEIRRCSGTQFDPRLVDVFVGLAEAGDPDAPGADALAQWDVRPESVTRDEGSRSKD